MIIWTVFKERLFGPFSRNDYLDRFQGMIILTPILLLGWYLYLHYFIIGFNTDLHFCLKYERLAFDHQLYWVSSLSIIGISKSRWSKNRMPFKWFIFQIPLRIVDVYVCNTSLIFECIAKECETTSLLENKISLVLAMVPGPKNPIPFQNVWIAILVPSLVTFFEPLNTEYQYWNQIMKAGQNQYHFIIFKTLFPFWN